MRNTELCPTARRPCRCGNPHTFISPPAVYVLSAAVIDTSLSGDTNIMLLGPYGAGDAGVEIIRCRKTVYVPAPYVGILLCSDLTPVEAWNPLREAIVDNATELPIGPSSASYVPQSSNLAQTPIPRSLCTIPWHPYPTRPCFSIATGCCSATCLGYTRASINRPEPSLQRQSGGGGGGKREAVGEQALP